MSPQERFQTLEEALEVFAAIEAAVKADKPVSFSVSDLFALASKLAINGKPEKKNFLYNEVILNHPNADERDCFRVAVDRYDQVRRRAGKHKEARLGLQKLDFPPGLGIKHESVYHEAVAQCYKAAGLYRQALDTQKLIICHARFTELSIAKQLHALEGALSMAVHAGRQLEVNDFTMQMYDLLRDENLDQDYRDRTSAMLFQCMGHQWMFNGDFKIALDWYLKALDAYAVDAYAVWHALLALYCIFKGKLTPDQDRLQELDDILRKHSSLIQKTKAQEFPEVYNLVFDELGIKKKFEV